MVSLKRIYGVNNMSDVYTVARQLILDEFSKEYPHGDVERLKTILDNACFDDVLRVANAVERFGIRTLMDVV